MNRFVSSTKNYKTMKRNFTAKSLFLLLAISLASLAQTSAQVEWGIAGGLNMANLKGSEFKAIADSSQPTFTGITRFRFGLFADIPLNNYWSFNPELYYSVKGGIQKLDSFYNETNISPGWNDVTRTVSNIDLNYIEIPLLVRFSTPLGRPTALYPYENSVKPFYLDLFGGPYISYLLSNTNDASYTLTRSSVQDTSETFNFSTKTKSSNAIEQINKIDFGAVMGMGVKWRFNRKSYLYLDLRYTLSMTNLNKGYWDREVQDPADPTKSITVSPKVQNAGTLSFALGYITNFSKRRYFNLFKPDRNRP
jgi:hypothetical protein